MGWMGVPREPVEELLGAPDRNLDVLDDAFSWRPALEPLDAIADVEALLDPHQLPVGAAAPESARPDAADHRMLRAERLRAPEPVGVPPPG